MDNLDTLVTKDTKDPKGTLDTLVTLASLETLGGRRAWAAMSSRSATRPGKRGADRNQVRKD